VTLKERMMTSTRLAGLLAGGTLILAASSASAQGPAPYEFGYGHLNFGIQASSHDLSQNSGFPLYLETARVQTSSDIGSTAIFDVGGGVRVWHQIYGGFSFSRGSNTNDGTITASIPHPSDFDVFRTATATAPDLKHVEQAIHLHAMWRFPITTKFDVLVGVGPSFYSVKQDLVTAIGVTEQGNPTTGVSITSVTVERRSDNTVGYNLSADGTYLLTRRFGVGGFMRFTGASAKLDVGNDTVDVDAGGFQIGFGGRVRF
jgi:hypothetical protein